MSSPFPSRTLAMPERRISKTGAPVSFSRASAGTYDPATDTMSGSSADSIPGVAVAVRGDPERYLALGLVHQNTTTLLFAPASYGGLPEPGMGVIWAGSAYTVRDVEPVAPDGTAIISRVVISR